MIHLCLDSPTLIGQPDSQALTSFIRNKNQWLPEESSFFLL